MSKIGRRPISIPDQVSVAVSDEQIVVKGPKGELNVVALPGINVEVKDQEVVVSRANEEKQTKANHGLIRSLIHNQVLGVSEGFKKTLKMVGTGYRVQAKGTGVNLQVGYSHDVEYPAPAGISIKVEGNDTIVIEGIDKQQVGQVAAEIRAIKPPEPYKGKGIRYEDEVVRRKQGKTTAA